MFLAIDIGNTNIVIGVYRGDELVRHWRLSTSASRTADEYVLAIYGLLGASGINKVDVTGAIVCSVVPSADRPLASALEAYLGVKPLFVGVDIMVAMPVAVDNPSEVGADRLVNAYAALKLHNPPLIVVDFGTAVTFDYVSVSGEYAGGLIAPGITMAAQALAEKTEKLPRVEVRRPAKVVGKSTVESMQSGIYYGFIGLVDGVIEKIIKEVKSMPRVVATGGLAPLVVGESRFINEADEHLTLKGLKFVYEGKG